LFFNTFHNPTSHLSYDCFNYRLLNLLLFCFFSQVSFSITFCFFFCCRNFFVIESPTLTAKGS
jgi:hypothetical protein